MKRVFFAHPSWWHVQWLSWSALQNPKKFSIEDFDLDWYEGLFLRPIVVPVNRPPLPETITNPDSVLRLKPMTKYIISFDNPEWGVPLYYLAKPRGASGSLTACDSISTDREKAHKFEEREVNGVLAEVLAGCPGRRAFHEDVEVPQTYRVEFNFGGARWKVGEVVKARCDNLAFGREWELGGWGNPVEMTEKQARDVAAELKAIGYPVEVIPALPVPAPVNPDAYTPSQLVDKRGNTQRHRERLHKMIDELIDRRSAALDRNSKVAYVKAIAEATVVHHAIDSIIKPNS